MANTGSFFRHAAHTACQSCRIGLPHFTQTGSLIKLSCAEHFRHRYCSLAESSPSQNGHLLGYKTCTIFSYHFFLCKKRLSSPRLFLFPMLSLLLFLVRNTEFSDPLCKCCIAALFHRIGDHLPESLRTPDKDHTFSRTGHRRI